MFTFLAVCILLSGSLLPAIAQPLTNVVFAAFDTETTGLDARSGRIVELAATKFTTRGVIESKSWLVDPHIRIPADSTRIHGITDKDVAGKPSIATVLPEFLAFTSNCVLIAHNARFDIKFIRAEARRSKTPLPSAVIIDLLKLSRKWFPDAAKHELGVIAAHLGLLEGRALHRADSDSELAAAIFLKGLEKHPQKTDLDAILKDASGKLDFADAKR